MNVSQIMSSPATTVEAKDSVSRAIAVLSRSGFGFLPVVESGKPVGVVTGRDIAVRAVGAGVDLSRIPISAIMTSPAAAIGCDEEVEDALILMRRRDLRRLVAVDAAGKVAGVLDLADLAGQAPDESVAKNLQRHAESLPKNYLLDAWMPVLLE